MVYVSKGQVILKIVVFSWNVIHVCPFQGMISPTGRLNAVMFYVIFYNALWHFSSQQKIYHWDNPDWPKTYSTIFISTPKAAYSNSTTANLRFVVQIFVECNCNTVLFSSSFYLSILVTIKHELVLRFMSLLH